MKNFMFFIFFRGWLIGFYKSTFSKIIKKLCSIWKSIFINLCEVSKNLDALMECIFCLNFRIWFKFNFEKLFTSMKSTFTNLCEVSKNLDARKFWLKNMILIVGGICTWCLTWIKVVILAITKFQTFFRDSIQFIWQKHQKFWSKKSSNSIL